MLKLYYDATNYIAVNHMYFNTDTVNDINDLILNNELGWGAIKKWSTGLYDRTGTNKASIESLNTVTKLYLKPNFQLETKWSIQSSTAYAPSLVKTIEIFYEDVHVQTFAYYDDWADDEGNIFFGSIFSNQTEYESNVDNMRAFIANAFSFEQKMVSGDNPGEYLGEYPVTSPFLVIHHTGSPLSEEIYALYNIALRGWGSAGNIARSLLGAGVVQVSPMTTVNGVTVLPSVAYDPMKFNVDLWRSGNENAYFYDNTVNKSVAYSWNNTTYVNNDSVISTDIEVADDTATGVLYANTPFIQFGDIFEEVPAEQFNINGRSGVYNIGTGWINTTPREYGTYYYTILQMRDYDSLKNAALINPTNIDYFKIPSSQQADIPALVLMTVSRTYLNSLAMSPQIGVAVNLKNGTTNELTGDVIIEHFFNNNTDPETTPTRPSPGDTTIPEDNGGGGVSDKGEIGGQGTWNDEGDDTTLNPDTPHNDPIAGVPEGMFGGLSTNTYVVRMNSSQLTKLMDTIWDSNFIDYVYTKLGSNGITEGVLDIKYGNIGIPTKQEVELVAIAGYPLTDKINCSTINQFNRFDFGTIDIPEYFGSFLDFEPYTQITLYLPKLQTGVGIPTNLVVGKSIQVLLTVDFQSGLGVYTVQNNEGTQIVTCEAKILESLPYAQRDWSGSTEAAVNNVGRAAQTVDSKVSTEISDRASGMRAIAGMDWLERGDMPGEFVSMDDLYKSNKLYQIGGGVKAGVISAAVSEAAQTAWSMTNEFATSWNSGSAGSMGGNNVAILKISRPYVQYPEQYVQMFGLPSSQIRTIGELTGYFEAIKIYPEFSIPADEMIELELVLTQGVYP